jgi:hypothetical protein
MLRRNGRAVNPTSRKRSSRASAGLVGPCDFLTNGGSCKAATIRDNEPGAGYAWRFGSPRRRASPLAPNAQLCL